MQEFNMLLLDTAHKMNLNIFKCDTYFCLRSEDFHEKMSPIVAKIKGKYHFLLTQILLGTYLFISAAPIITNNKYV